MTDLKGKTLLASGFHAPERGSIDELRDALIAVREDGVIASVLRPGDEAYEAAVGAAARAGTLVRLPKGHYLLPGLVDLHVHAPQYPQLGQALDVPLEVWLHKYTFPLEARYADVAFARRNYGLLVEDLLANGTTTALYFATIHRDATRILVDACLERGQRALVGKVVMDNADQCPDYYRDASAQAAVDGAAELIDYVRAHPDNGHGLVRPVVTPRFIPACTDASLVELGALAKSCGCHVQTHCSESDWEHGYVLERYGVTDTAALDRFGLLGRLSVLAHANFITPDDMDTIRVRRSAVAHCPLSNAYFANAVFPLKAALEKGLNVGLGTDISGGPSASLFDGMRGAVMASRMLETGTDPDVPPEKRSSRRAARIDFRDAFHLATAAGGTALDLPVGQFAAGYHFDACVIDTQAVGGTIRLLQEDLDRGEGILQKIVYTASRTNIATVWVGGRAVAGGFPS
ncbi:MULTISPECIES: guanine deaminase [unclassified Mesorhizobium]|uniref:guanine deaminase n=1 Tax=unclassified Mesorhizobium TaxID=325217 RepID=UPI000F753FE5|nr:MULTISPECIES: guanine deaminase [unclassified Mesorhizobium]AZO05733.1 guanine deaminase [Mesorhizobium sp. M2A.F.Ca.ET.043.02.1.1]RUW43208.1 guanine deaminase [Mesorhizobium sp. M2A.F.Ca.ET.015.02.1.1]RVC96234.1 guanine deaminase [Mesorhizobium sp. M2A.F.Ca.ET.017.03.2.1]RVD10199.1 guanine deaminase [Mesorhizobium sp. M2A.F.Ca.ET.029.05.1.1]RWB48941.1 MAG: guanine deaminase [Mesorhizobium sp.]